MKRGRSAVGILVTAILVTWHGLLLGLPHTHADRSVPRYEAFCSADHPGTQPTHWHGTPRSAASHPCLACLVGSTLAAGDGKAPAASRDAASVCASSSLSVPAETAAVHLRLPSLRAPPRGRR